MINLIMLFLFVFFISLTSSSSVNTAHKCSPQQTLSLLLFKQNLSSINDTLFDYTCEEWLGSGYNPVMMNWNKSTDCCEWNGVTCDHSTGDVIGLDLSCGMLQGTIHHNSTLFHLPRLERLNLAFNDFYDSELPTDIGKVSNSLTHLNVSGSGFTGQVPTDISHFYKLVSLDLSLNYFNLDPRFFINLVQNLTVLEELSLENVVISSILPANLNISSSLRLLNLGTCGLQGNLPHNIFNLRSLERLDLSFNNFTGHIPSKISLLSKLVSLDLSWNGMDNLLIQPYVFSVLFQNSTVLKDLHLSQVNIGLILLTYLNISSPLRSLDLSSTSLQWRLPNNILNLKNLEKLDLSWNDNLSGPLPEVNSSTNILSWLDVSGTSLSGEIPNSIGHLNSLVHLSLSGCNFSGTLPKSIVNLKQLDSLYLSSNKLTGTLPSSLFTIPSLKFVSLSSNMFQGNMPPELFSLRSLKLLSLSNNQLTGQIDVLGHGPIPHAFQKLTNLTHLDLSYNNFRGNLELDTLLLSLKNLDVLSLSHSGVFVTISNPSNYVKTNIRVLSLASCSLKVIPNFLQNMSGLRHLDLSSNDIHGHIPDWVGEIGENQLLLLDLSKNSISGTVPNVFKEWSRLQGFLLNGNQLEGKVPTSLHKCRNLRIIDLGNNHLNDTFPGWLADLPILKALVLRSNNFYGRIVTSFIVENPFPCLRVLDLSHNGFVGQLPTKYFQNFNAMKNVIKKNSYPEYVYIGLMYYSINVSVKGTDLDFSRILVDYTIIDLSSNRFDSEIPNIMGNLNSLKVLNLSHNSLKGEIPQALGKLSEIESLDLSWNQLIGEIPQSLTELLSLGFLNLSQNHLVGHIPHGKQFDTFDADSFGGNPKLCGPQLPNNCSENPREPQNECDDEEASGFTWKTVMVGYGCGIVLGFVLGHIMLSIGRPQWFTSLPHALEYMIFESQNKRRF